MNSKLVAKLEREYLMDTYKRPSVVFKYGKGCFLFDEKNKSYVDMISGIATAPLGHNNPEI